MRVVAFILLVSLVGACAKAPQTIIETRVENCPRSIQPPDCPDLPGYTGKSWEVALEERGVFYEGCKAWADLTWKAIKNCEVLR